MENSAVGTSVGIIASAIDADIGDNVTYTLSDDAGGLFGIGETSGEVTVSGSLDYETAASHLSRFLPRALTVALHQRVSRYL